MFGNDDNQELDRNNLPIKNRSIADIFQVETPSSRIPSDVLDTRYLNTKDNLTNERFQFGIDQNIEAVRAGYQGGFELTGKALVQGIGEVTLGTLENIGYLLDAEQHKNIIQGTEKEYSNWFSDLMKFVKEYVNQEVAPIYQTESAQQGFAPGDATWWAGNAGNIASTLSLLIPAAGATRVGSFIGKGLGRLALKGASKAGAIGMVEAGNALMNSRKVGAISEGVTTAIFSRYMENTMEASGTYDEEYQKQIAMGTDPVEAARIAGDAASTAWKNNWGNIVFDILQYMSLTKGLNATNRASKAFRKNLLQKTGAFVGNIAQEGIEEGAQFVISQEAQRKARMGKDYEGLKDITSRISDYAEDPEFKASVLLGAVGGGVFSGLGGVYNKIQKLGNKNQLDLEKQRALDRGDTVTANKISDIQLMNTAYDHIAQGKLGDLRTEYAQYAQTTDEELTKLGLSEEEISTFRERNKEIQNDLQFIEEEYLRLEDDSTKSPQLRKKALSDVFEKRTTTRQREAIQKETQRILSEVKNEDTTQGFKKKELETKLFVAKDQRSKINEKEYTKYEFGKQSLKKIDSYIVELEKELENYKEVKPKPTSKDADLVKQYAEETVADLNLEVLDAHIELMQTEEGQNKMSEDQVTMKHQALLAIVDDNMTIKEIDDVLKEEGIRSQVKAKLRKLADKAAETKKIPTKESFEGDVVNRYESTPLLFSELAEIKRDNRNLTVSDIKSSLDFLKKYNRDKKFKEAVDKYYEKLIKNSTEKQTENIPSPIEVINESAANSEYADGMPVDNRIQINDKAISQNHQYIMYARNGDTVKFFGVKDDTLNRGVPIALANTYGYMEFKEGGPYIAYNKEGQPVRSETNTLKDKDGNETIFLSDEEFRILNDPNSDLYGLPIQFEVPLNSFYNPDTTDQSYFEVILSTEYNGKKLRLGKLRGVDRTQDIGKNSSEIRELRKQLLQEWVESEQKDGTFISQRNDITIAGRTNGHFNIAGNYRIAPLQALGKNKPFFIGVVHPTKDGGIELKTNGGEKVHNIEPTNIYYDRYSSLQNMMGKTVMFIQSADGRYIPIGLYTSKLKEVPQAQREVNAIVDEMFSNEEFLNRKADHPDSIAYIEDLNRRLQEYLSITLTYMGSRTFQTISLSKDPESQRIYRNAQEMKYGKDKLRGFDSLIMRVDANRINTPGYNEMLSEKGWLKTNLSPNDHILAAQVKLDISKLDKGKVPTPAKKKEPATITKPTPAVTPAVEEPIDIETQKADIEGETVFWDYYGNEKSSNWNIGKKTKTRKGEDAVELIQQRYVGGMLSTVTEIVPLSVLQEQINAKYDAELAALEETTQVKEGVSEVFDENSELSEIGTQEQYSEYLDTIFPDSKVKDIVYHGTDAVFEKFKPTKPKFDTLNSIEGVYNFTTNKEFSKRYGKNILVTILNIKNPIQEKTSGEFIDDMDRPLSEGLYKIGKKKSDNILAPKYDESLKNTDAIINRIEGDNYALPVQTVISVFEPEQIHILGSKQDVEGFKNHVSKTTEQRTVSENAPVEDIIPQNEYNDFVDKGIVTKERIASIAEKVKKAEQLSPREMEIFTDKTSEINAYIVAEEKAPSDIQESVEQIGYQETTGEIDSFLDLNDLEEDEGYSSDSRERRVVDSVEYKRWNKQEELLWFNSKYPNIPVKVLEDLRKVANNGGIPLWGLFKNGAIYISDQAASGTVYHEAFHAVFHTLLNQKEADGLLNELKYSNKKYVSMNKVELEEVLTDRFMDYKLTEGNDTKGLSDNIKDFFKRLYHLIQIAAERVGIKKGASIDSYMYRIDKGLYNKFSINQRFTKDVSRFRQQYDSGKLSPREESMAIGTVNNILLKRVLPLSAKKLGLKKDTDATDIIRAVISEGKSLESLYAAAYMILNRDRMNMDLPISEEGRQYIQRVLDSLGTNTVGQKFKLSSLAVRAAQDLSVRYGIGISVDQIVSEEDIAIDEELEEGKPEGWQIDSFTEHFSKFSQRAKMAFATVDAGIDPAGYTIFENPIKVYNKLGKTLVNSLNEQDMIKRLDDLIEIYPSYESIKEKIQNDSNLRGEMWYNMGQMKTVEFIGQASELEYDPLTNSFSNEVRTFVSNRRNASADIITEWQSNFYASDYYNRSNGEITVPQEFKQRVEELSKQVSQLSPQAPLQKDNRDSLFTILKDLSIPVQRSKIEKVFTLDVEGKKRFQKFIGGTTKGLLNIVSDMVNGKDPFFNADIEGSLSVKAMANEIVKGTDDTFKVSFKSMDGKMVHTHVNNRFTLDLINQLKNSDPQTRKNIIDRYMETPFYKSSPIFAEFRNENVISKVSMAYSDGARENNKEDKIAYSNMTKAQLEAFQISQWFNYKYKKQENWGYYMIPPLADASIASFMYYKKDNEVVTRENLVKTAQQERDRIQWLQKRIKGIESQYEKWRKDQFDEDIPYLEKSPLPEELSDISYNLLKNGLSYQVFKKLNDTDGRAKEFKSDSEFETAVNEMVDATLESEKDKMLTDGVLSKNKEGKYVDLTNMLSDRVVNDLNTQIDKYLLSRMYMNAQTMFLFGGDVAAYNSNEGKVDYRDVFKRIKQVHSPQNKLSVDPTRTFTLKDGSPVRVRENYYNAYIQDPTEVEAIVSKHIELIDSLFPGPENEWIRKKYRELNNTDAATIIDIFRAREIYIGTAQWTDALQEQYDAIIKGDAVGYNPKGQINVKKPFNYQHRFIIGKNGDVHVESTQIKNSEAVLTPQMAKGNPKLEKILEKMGYTFNKDGSVSFDPNKRLVDSVIFASAVKVGQFNTLNSVDEITGENVHQMKNSEYALQMETPEHYIDSEILAGTQMRKLVVQDLDKKATYIVNGKPMSGQELFDQYQEAIQRNIEESFEQLKKMFYKEDGSPDLSKIVNVLRKEVIERQLGDDMLKSLDWLNSEKLDTVLPLWDPHIVYNVEAIMHSYFKNNITKQKMFGPSLYNATSYGYEDINNKGGLRKPQLVFAKDEKGNDYLKEVEVIMPAWSKDIFKHYIGKDGHLDINAVPEDLRMGIFYRIPTEGKYSMFHIKVIGFVEGVGGQIIMPDEVTTIAGLDFDIDKLYGMMYHFKGVNRVKTRINYSKSWKDLKTQAVYTDEGVNTMRTSNKESVDAHFGNPWSAGGYSGTIKTDTVEEAVENYKDWLLTDKFNDVKPDQRNWILEQINSGKLDNVKLLYDKSLIARGKGSHAESLKQAVLKLRSEDIAIEKIPSGMDTKESRDNLLIDLQYAVLSHPDTIRKQLTPGNYNTLNEVKKEVLKLEGKESEELNVLLPSTYREVFERNMTGASLIGVAANQNVNHALMTEGDFYFTEGVDFNGDSRNRLSEIYNVNGTLISSVVAEDLAAFVDNAKDPIAAFLNITSTTADAIAMMKRVGHDPRAVHLLFASPAGKQFSRELAKIGKSRSNITKTLKKLMKNIEDDLRGRKNYDMENFYEYMKQSTKDRVTVDTIVPTFKDRESIESMKTDYSIYQLLISVFQKSDALVTAMGAMRYDSVNNAAGPRYADTEVLKRKWKKALKDEGKVLIGFKDLIGKGNIPYVEGFYSLGVEMLNEKGQNIIADIAKLPYEKSIFADLIERFGNYKKEGELNADEIDNIQRYIMTAMVSGYSTFAHSDMLRTIEDLPQRVLDYKNDNDGGAYSILMEQFTVTTDPVDKKNRIPFPYIKFDRTGLDNIHKNDVKKAWERMIYSENDVERQLAKDLAKYAFYSTGYTFNFNSFSDLVPVAFIAQLKEADEYQSYREYLTRMFNKDFSQLEKEFLFEQIVRNGYRGLKSIPFIDPRNNEMAEIRKIDGEERVVISANEVRFKEDPITGEVDGIIKYIKVPMKTNKGTETLLMELVSSQPDGFNNVQYRVLERLGVHNQFMEFDINRLTERLQSEMQDVNVELENLIVIEESTPSERKEVLDEVIRLVQVFQVPSGTISETERTNVANKIQRILNEVGMDINTLNAMTEEELTAEGLKESEIKAITELPMNVSEEIIKRCGIK